MFEDIITKDREDGGCWSCEHATTAFFSLYCQKYNKFINSFDGQDCVDYKERNVCFGV